MSIYTPTPDEIDNARARLDEYVKERIDKHPTADPDYLADTYTLLAVRAELDSEYDEPAKRIRRALARLIVREAY